MAADISDNRPIQLTAEDAERLVRKIQALEDVLRELVSYLSMDSSPLGSVAGNRMLAAMSEEDLDGWLRRKIQA
jgi:hypothetical protein